MSPHCEIAFKEWSVICHALAEGKQTLILRKGGIHEGREGFRVAHREFWLFPTFLHQEDRLKLVPEAWPVLDATTAVLASTTDGSAAETIAIQLYAEVFDVIELCDETGLPKLAGFHWWSDQTISDRFAYRNPGLFLLVVRVSKLAQAIEIPNSPHFAGCRSWVDLPAPLPTSGLTPVMCDADFQAERSKILLACRGDIS